MCGFAGFFGNGLAPAGSDARRRALLAMGEAIAHRGPDEVSYLDEGPLGLVFRRLAILDPIGGGQPIESESGRHVLVMNGEIYNHEALRLQLQPRHRFVSRGDAEAAVHAWEEWGAAALERLVGMFAMLVWDRDSESIVLARDRLGIKPLYVAEVPGGLLFGSELKALLAHPDCPRDLDWQVLDRMAIQQDPETSYVCGIELLPGGEAETVDRDCQRERRRWWSLEGSVGTGMLGTREEPYIAAYAGLLERVTLEHLQGDVGAGLLLSGGLDSSLLAAIVARHRPGFPCFTIVERSAVLGGDIDSASRLTRQLGLNWHPILFDHRTLVKQLEFGLDSFERAIWMMDSPRFDLEWLFKSEAQRIVRAIYPDLKILLLGQGADEFAGGYSHRIDAPHADWAGYLRDEVLPAVTGMPGLAPYHRMMLMHLRQLQHFNLWHEDRTSSFHSLEARVPYLDHRLVELLAGIPEALHESLFWRKRIVREALARLAPQVVLRQPKMGFLCGQDRSSLDAIHRALALSVYPAFRDRYAAMASFPFDTSHLDRLFADARRYAPGFGEAAHALAQCMAVAVFQAQCSGDVAVPVSPAVGPVLPMLKPEAWPASRAAWLAPPVADLAWNPEQPVRTRAELHIDVPEQGASGGKFVFRFGGERAGVLKVPKEASWQDRFLRELAVARGTTRSAGEWARRLGVAQSDFGRFLGMLAILGALDLA